MEHLYVYTGIWICPWLMAIQPALKQLGVGLGYRLAHVPYSIPGVYEELKYAYL